MINKIMKDHYVNVLAEIVSAKTKKEVTTLEGILENLHCLTKHADFESFESGSLQQSWLPVEYKRMLLLLLFDGTAALKSEIVEYVANQYVVARATVSKIGNADMVYSSCEKRIAFDDVEPFAGYTDAKRNILMQCYALGGAESKALTYAGIGMEFCGDLREFSMFTDGNENGNETVKNEQFVADNPDVIKNMEEIMDKEHTSPSPVSDPSPAPAALDPEEKRKKLAEKIIIPIGEFAGKKLSEIDKPTKIAGWLLANYDGGRIDPNKDPDNYEYLFQYVNHNQPAMKVYRQVIEHNKNAN